MTHGRDIFPITSAPTAAPLQVGGSRRLDLELHRDGRMIAAMIPAGIAIVTTVMAAGSVDLREISLLQAGGWHRWLAFHDPFSLIGCGLCFVAGLVGVYRDPYIVHSSPMSRIAGRGLMWMLAAAMATLWLGACYDPFGLVKHLVQLSHSGSGVSNWNVALIADVLGASFLVLKSIVLVWLWAFACQVVSQTRKRAAGCARCANAHPVGHRQPDSGCGVSVVGGTARGISEYDANNVGYCWAGWGVVAHRFCRLRV